MRDRWNSAIICLSILIAQLGAVQPSNGALVEAIEAKVNDEIIFASEIDDAMRFSIPLEQLSDEQYDRERINVLMRMIREKLIVQECKRMVKELGVDQALVNNAIQTRLDEELARYNAQFDTPEAREQNMKMQGFNEETLREFLLDRAETMYYIQTAAPSLIRDRVEQVNESDLEEFKKKYPEQYNELEYVTVRHILFRCAEDAREDVVEKAKARAEEVLLRLKAGESFTELAAQYSEHEQSRNNGGLLGKVQRGKWSEAYNDFVDQLFAAPKGQPIGPLRSPLGIHVCLIIEKSSAENALQRLNLNKALMDWVEEIRKRPNTFIYVKGAKPGGIDLPLTAPDAPAP